LDLQNGQQSYRGCSVGSKRLIVIFLRDASKKMDRLRQQVDLEFVCREKRNSSLQRAGQKYGKNGPAVTGSGTAAHAEHSMVLLHGVLDE
jgi:hypothetical protein